MTSALLILSIVGSWAAGWLANQWWVQWERGYRHKHSGPPPGGDAIGYAVIIAGLFGGGMATYRVLLWMG